MFPFGVVSIELFQMAKGATRVETLGTCEGAHSDLVAFSEFHVSSQFFKTLVSVFVARVNNPTICLHEHGRSQIILRVPPVARAC